MIESILAKLGTLGSGLDSDYADRLNFRYTSLGLITLGVLVTTRQFVGMSSLHVYKLLTVFRKITNSLF